MHSGSTPPRPVEVAIAPQFEQLCDQAIAQLFHRLDTLDSHTLPPGELSIALVDEATICQLHEQFLGDPSPTDVITFPGDPDEALAGEIVVSVDQAAREHTRHGQSFDAELQLYLIHGWLHLCGEDDLTEPARARMRAAEQQVITALSQGETPVRLTR